MVDFSKVLMTFTGTLSMLSDKLFKFRLETMKLDFLTLFKNAFVVINISIESNSKALSDLSVVESRND